MDSYETSPLTGVEANPSGPLGGEDSVPRERTPVQDYPERSNPMRAAAASRACRPNRRTGSRTEKTLRFPTVAH